MKKRFALIIIVLMLTGAYSFAGNPGKTTLCVQGSADNQEQVTFFVEAFTAEATASGYEISTEFDFKFADYGIKFEILPNANVVENRFVLTINLVRIKDLVVLASASYAFSELEEMRPYTQYLFYKLTANIPGRGMMESDAWKNKWLYIRASFNYPITVYELQPDGLVAGTGLYTGSYDTPASVMPLDNRINALPGGTFGLEIQFLNWLSLEPNASMAMEEFFGNYYYTFTAGAELKFPIKIKNLMIEPYGIFSYPLIVPDVFTEFPQYGYGGGVQINIKGGNIGAFFVDVNYIYMPGRAIMKNPYKDLYPDPEQIHWRRFVIGIGAGYKLGIISKKNR